MTLEAVARMVVDALATNKRFGVTVIIHAVDVAVLVEALIRSGGPVARLLDEWRGGYAT